MLKDTTRRPEWGSNPRPLDPESDMATAPPVYCGFVFALPQVCPIEFDVNDKCYHFYLEMTALCGK